MLVELKVSDFAIIDSVQISFKPGLNILSGETGAGKSVLLKSLALLMGDKAETESVRTGKEQATIEGCFDLSRRPDIREKLNELGVTVDEDTLVVRRIVSRQGKSRIYLNGSLTPLQTLRDVVTPLIEVAGQTAPLIEMTGQHDNRHLLAKGYHLDLLDQYAATWQLRQGFSQDFGRVHELDEKITQLTNESRTRAQRLDFLLYQRDEIRALNLQAEEEVELENEVRRMKNAARLSEFVNSSEDSLYGDDDSALARLHTVFNKAQELSKYDPHLLQMTEPLQQAQTLIQDVTYELRNYMKNLGSDGEALENLEKRLSSLRHLQKKYGATVAEILEALNKIEQEIDLLENSETHLKAFEKQRSDVLNHLKVLAKDLTDRRVQGAKLLEKGVNDELEDLNMRGVIFKVKIDLLPEFNSTGADDVEFMTQTSKKDPARALAKFASGGELSRILLSVKQVIGHSKHPRTYLFDEVDTGVSGPTAEKVGRKLKAIARDQQVICVTHLPQVACFGDVHFYIHKSADSSKGVHMDVVELRKKQRVEEIARLISGEKITKTSLAHAEQLLEIV